MLALRFVREAALNIIPVFVRIELDRLGVIGNGLVILAVLFIRVPAIAIVFGIVPFELDRPKSNHTRLVQERTF
jgi:hypothetical protein